MMQKLSDLCSFADGRVAVADLDLDTYISTENMLPNKEGVIRSAGLPTILQTQAYQVEDVLVSNIRPYFRKIWFANRNGGCSNDVLVLRANEAVYPGFLYYLLSDDNFFDYATATAKGTKMPRGDKGAIMCYEVPDLPLDMQIGIANTLAAIDAKIANNKKINHHLEQMAQAIFKSWFVDFEPFGGVMPEGWQSATLGDICSYGTERVPIDDLTKQTYISTENMLHNRGGFVDASSLPSVVQTTRFQQDNILISNIRPYFKKIIFCSFAGGCSADVLCFQAREKSFAHYIYCALFNDSFFDYMVAGSKGTKMPRGDRRQIMNYPIIIPPDNILGDFAGIITQVLSGTEVNNNENRILAALRDTLLPRLMSGELSIDTASITQHNDNI